MNKEIEIPEGYEARIEGNKVILELKESEDERIRKWLIAVIEEVKTDDDWCADLNKCDEAIAWLKKQKENIEKEYVFRPLAGTDITTAAEQAICKAKEGEHLVLAFNGMYTPVSKYNSEKGLVDKYNTYLKEQEPTEWSEKDKTILDNIIAYKVLNIDDMEWLKALPERFNLQPKQEWSDKDKEMFGRCIANAKKHIPIPDKNGHLAKIEERVDEELVDWLKERFL